MRRLTHGHVREEFSFLKLNVFENFCIYIISTPPFPLFRFSFVLPLKFMTSSVIIIVTLDGLRWEGPSWICAVLFLGLGSMLNEQKREHEVINLLVCFRLGLSCDHCFPLFWLSCNCNLALWAKETLSPGNRFCQGILSQPPEMRLREWACLLSSTRMKFL